MNKRKHKTACQVCGAEVFSMAFKPKTCALCSFKARLAKANYQVQEFARLRRMEKQAKRWTSSSL